VTHTVLVPATRVARWFENFGTRHDGSRTETAGGALLAYGGDGATAVARLPWDRPYDGPPDPGALVAEATRPTRWGILLVRKGGFAVAGGTTPEPSRRKVGQRHVQGRSKAGGWSQQRFARRREGQARQAFEAAADHAARILVDELHGVDVLCCGGDHAAVDAVLADPRLTRVAQARCSRWLSTGDPKASALAQAITDAWSVGIEIDEASAPHDQ
jgi:hypothetical protein